MQSSIRSRRCGVTLIEMLVATAVTLLLVGMVVSIFGVLSERVSDARATIEMSDRLRATKQQLQQDLQGVTTVMRPPLRPEQNLGYFEVKEGPIGPIVSPQALFYVDQELNGYTSGVDVADQTIGDVDDLLQFTSRSQHGAPFLGRFGNGTTQSDVAEISWFLRGTTLYRRMLLVLPDRQVETLPDFDSNKDYTFYSRYDVSVRQEGGPFDVFLPAPTPPRLVTNSLGDLTKRENRYAHQPWVYPHHTLYWGALGLPTLRECSYINNNPVAGQRYYWPFPLSFPLPDNAFATTNVPQPTVPGNLALILPEGSGAALPYGFYPLTKQQIDLWNSPHRTSTLAVNPQDIITGTLDNQQSTGAVGANSYMSNNRIAEDVILTDVIQFDVKCWDPGAPVFNMLDSGSPPNVVGTLSPGEQNYLAGALLRFIADPITPLNRPIGYGAYVDLNYMCLTGAEPTLPDSVLPPGPRSYESALRLMEGNLGVPFGTFPRPSFAHAGDLRSPLRGRNPISLASLASFPLPPGGTAPPPATYDTWSFHYERDGINQDDDFQLDNTGNQVGGGLPLIDEGTNGIDDFTPAFAYFPAQGFVGGVDDDTEMESPPPYRAPLRGIQVKIRVFERDTRQIREVTVVQDFKVD
ncbi:MAG: prepilin-type N-terminal cleavage/methylation domain-containing protein [Planctomycetes bacterium]|nr:prepilin-type N-terminal cleavage/methylation domain-containing protein [Planctomycetota bacterium]